MAGSNQYIEEQLRRRFSFGDPMTYDGLGPTQSLLLGLRTRQAIHRGISAASGGGAGCTTTYDYQLPNGERGQTTTLPLPPGAELERKSCS